MKMRVKGKIMSETLEPSLHLQAGTSSRDQRQEKGEHLYALLIKLRAQSSGTLLPHAGQLAHAALLHWFAQVDPMFATHLHEPNQRRPFTCSSLWFPGSQKPISSPILSRLHHPIAILPQHLYWLRVTLLTEHLFQTFLARFFQKVVPNAGEIDSGPGLPILRLGEVPFDVVEVTTTPVGADQDQVLLWSRHTTYSQLVEQARVLDGKKSTIQHIGLEFCSPTAFSNGQHAGGKQMWLFPDPQRVFDSLARSWNHWAPSQFVLDLQAIQTYVRDWVAVTEYDLQTHVIHFDRATQTGFTGRCIYTLLEMNAVGKCHAPPSLAVGAALTPAQALYLLSIFAFFAGVGYKTTMGMGQTRCLF